MLRPFTAEHDASGVEEDGPRYHVVVLESSQGDCAARATRVEQYEKDRDARYDRLASRWGETSPWSLQTTLLRTEQEEIPEPWAPG